ncbi:hypothetical protein UFOVP408_45 [uncultured Caudovirales phage]|uniref:Uncharacterized protein n=1 Tax=uncultured Caudovirales phage TaxID=2100421 RepID=A0A6J5NDB3_9CAUD|nr:hypothetical protein UFOVP356_48 [uncultured Caudovirales phage]CAB4140622.1 hypothetical protein UFOVP408_45 [uncultured Caudovirales phage]CAB4156913.1 hypothetical protein UFOVP676_28 [uncultured Caudovirales phage]
MTLESIIHKACAALPVRAQYARDVIEGDQRWSGADLRGKAKKFGAGYARQRNRARTALFAAGGCIVAIDRGLNVTATVVGTDDMGRTIYQTTRGIAVQVSADRAKLVRA